VLTCRVREHQPFDELLRTFTISGPRMRGAWIALRMAVRPASSPDGFSAQECRAGCSAEILALARWVGDPLK
jgi:hypothetical protein